MLNKPELQITLMFTRNTGVNKSENFHHSFTSDDSLDPILEKMELFLTQLGFVLDGRRLDLVDGTRDQVGVNPMYLAENFDFTNLADNVTLLHK